MKSWLTSWPERMSYLILELPVFQTYSKCWAFKHSVFVVVFIWTVGVMSQRPLLVLDMGSANDVHILSMIVWLCVHLGESPLTRLRAPGGRLLCHADPPSHTFSTKKPTLSHFQSLGKTLPVSLTSCFSQQNMLLGEAGRASNAIVM